jgi:hypothetical protein
MSENPTNRDRSRHVLCGRIIIRSRRGERNVMKLNQVVLVWSTKYRDTILEADAKIQNKKDTEGIVSSHFLLTA